MFLPTCLLLSLILHTAATSAATAATASTAEDSFLVQVDVNLARGKKGSFVLEIHPSWAPLGVERFREIVTENVSHSLSLSLLIIKITI